MTETPLHDRYGGLPAPALAPLNPVLDLLFAHRSIRAFRPDPLPPNTVETLVAAAQSAPTSSNLQSWSVVAVEDPARRARLSVLAANQKFIRDAPLMLVWLADLSRLQRIGEAHQRRLEGLEFLESFLIAALDAALAAQNAVVALESMGLGGVYVGAMRNRPAEVAAELALPPNAVAVFGLAVGWPDPAVETAVKPRLPQSAVLHREQYGTAAEAGAVAAYDTALRDFAARQGMVDQGWIAKVMSRVGTPASLSGRDRMREVLNGLGFGLR